ncbi:MAG: 3-dehydroquinate synthase [Candidatus Zixiibacteriota bacterium]
MPEIVVNLNKRSYPVVVGSGIGSKLPARLRRIAGDARLFVFYDANFYALHGHILQKSLEKDFRTVEIVSPSGERFKSQRQLNKIHDLLFAEKVTRSDLILACGGGVTGDLVGFAASSALRGIRWGIVSTTLLGMVDAAIGGKTGVNHPLGKNLIGSFWQPSIVWCDIDYLATLPTREWISGLGEVIKYGGLMGGPVLEWLYDIHDWPVDQQGRMLQKVVVECSGYKARVVAADETERGQRMVLNLGHTFSHAIEATVGFGKLTHGEALIIGLKAAVDLSCILSRRREATLKKYDKILTGFLKYVRRRRIDAAGVMKAMQVDKKRGNLTAKFILLEKPGRPIIAEGINRDLVYKSLLSALEVYGLFGGRNA